MDIDRSLAIIVRATGETTTQLLVSQLKKQIEVTDCLHVLDKVECFEDKLKYGYELGLKENKAFTVFIDADILLRNQAVKQIKRTVTKLKETDLGFGLRLWDRFYDRPKFRGLHIYRTELLKKAIPLVPEPSSQLRPESFTKKKLLDIGHPWRNDISFYLAGLHDFYQKADDIYYKFLIRSKRSQNDLNELKHKFRSVDNKDFKIALLGIEDGEKMSSIANNKFLYKKIAHEFSETKGIQSIKYLSVDLIVLKKLFIYYNFNRLFWNSI